MQYKSAREMIKDMDNGIIKRQHLGAKNFYVLKQELFSLKNEYTPSEFTEEESNKWNITLAARLEEVEQLSLSEQGQLSKLVNKMLDPNS